MPHFPKPLAAVMSVTETVSPDGAITLDIPLIQRQLLASGAAGLTIQRVLRGRNAVEFRFVPSPFFPGLGEAAFEIEAAARRVVATYAQQGCDPVQTAQADGGPTIDPRLIEPGVMPSWRPELNRRYRLVSLTEKDPTSAREPGRGEQRGGWERALRLARDPSPRMAAVTDPVEAVRIWDTPVFHERVVRWPGYSRGPEREGGPKSFLPQNLEIRSASDKPGATVLQRIQPVARPIGGSVASLVQNQAAFCSSGTGWSQS